MFRPFNPFLVNQGDPVAVYSETRQKWIRHKYICTLFTDSVVVEAADSTLLRFPRSYCLSIEAVPGSKQQGAPNESDYNVGE